MAMNVASKGVISDFIINRKKTDGNFIIITTTYTDANAGTGYAVPSAVAKAGVNSLVRSLSVEWDNNM